MGRCKVAILYSSRGYLSDAVRVAPSAVIKKSQSFIHQGVISQNKLYSWNEDLGTQVKSQSFIHQGVISQGGSNPDSTYACCRSQSFIHQGVISQTDGTD